MTDREPFARVVRRPERAGNDSYLVVCNDEPVSFLFDAIGDAQRSARLINAAFNKRLDEEIAKARAEWESTRRDGRGGNKWKTQRC